MYSYNYFYQNLDVKAYEIENILVTKHLFDKGLDVSRITSFSDSILPDVLDILFSDKVDWQNIKTEWPVDLDKDELEDELEKNEDCWYCSTLLDFLDRDSFLINIKVDEFIELKGKLRPKHYQKIMDKLKTLVGERQLPERSPEGLLYDEEYFPFYHLFYDVDWLKENKNIIGFQIHFVELNQNWSWEEPLRIRELLMGLVDVYDTIKEITKEVAANVRLRRNYSANKTQRFRLCRGKRANFQRKRDKPQCLDRTYKRVVGI